MACEKGFWEALRIDAQERLARGEAIPPFKAVLAGLGRVLGPDDPQTLASRNNLAAGYRARPGYLPAAGHLVCA